MITVGMRLVEGLAARGVEVVFGIPGVHTVELYRGLSGSSIRHVTARHEAGCAFMADGYARASGKPGVAFVITGPGVLNALTAMAQAKADSVPMLVISGVNARASLGRGLGYLHEMPDQAGVVAALCPTRRLTDPADLGAVLDWAFATMTGGRPTPVHIEIPTDVMPMDCDALPAPVDLRRAAVIDSAAVQTAADRLNGAKRVVILAGGGARGSDDALQALAQALDAPVVQTVNARGMMYDHPLTVPASPSLTAVRALILGADQVLALGTEIGPTDYDMYALGGLPDLSGMIRVDICGQQLARHPAALTLQADAGAVMRALLPRVLARQGNGGIRAAATRHEARAELAVLDAAMPERLAMVEVIRNAIPRAQIVGDSTQPIYAANLYYDHDRAGGWFNAATGFGALGYGPGAAIGAALALPDAHTVCLIGDGGLQFSAAELRTAVDAKIPMTFLVWNNAAYAEIADAMRAANTEVIGCDPSPLNLAAFAEACDLQFASVALEAEALHDALAQPCDRPRLIEIRVPK
jgi:acetolactate synthase I/II/III large subunit